MTETDFVLRLRSRAGAPLPAVASRGTGRLRIGVLPGPADLDYYAGHAGTINMFRQANFAELPLEALEPMARDLEQTARALRLRAAEVRVRRRRWQKAERRVDAMARTPGIVQRNLDAGVSFEAAISSFVFPQRAILRILRSRLNRAAFFSSRRCFCQTTSMPSAKNPVLSAVASIASSSETPASRLR